MLDQATQVTIVILLAGISYQAGQHSNRILSLEEWKKEFAKTLEEKLNRFEDSNERKLDRNDHKLDRIEKLIKGDHD